MSKNKDKSKNEQYRQHVAKFYANKLYELKEQNFELRKQNDEMKLKLLEAEEKVRQLEDWNERLLTFMDMSAEEFCSLKKSIERNADLEDMLATVYGSLQHVGMLF